MGLDRIREKSATSVLLLTALALLATSALLTSSDDADAWTTTSKYADPDDYVSGSALYYTSTTSYWVFNYTSVTVQYGSGYEYRGWLGVPLGDLDPRTDLNSAELHFYVSGLSATFDLQVTLLKFDPTASDAKVTYEGIHRNCYDVGRGDVDSTGDWYISVTGGALSHMEGLISDGEDHVFFGFIGMTMGPGMTLDPSRSYVEFEHDSSAPNVPRMNGLSKYTEGSTLTVTWNTVTDLPAGGSTGGVEYVLGIFVFPEDGAEPTGWSSWTAGTSMDVYYLEDNMTYYFRAIASDANGFVSAWSSAVSTTMDASPPTVPVLVTEPGYTAGTSNVLSWAASTDAGIGNVEYEVQVSTTPDLSGASTYTTSSTTHTFTSLSSGTTYYYRVRARDGFDHCSGWSAVQHSCQDDAPPSAPELVAEPYHSPGTANTFSWHPSRDAGVGVDHYRVQVATRSDFGTSTIVLDVDTEDTLVRATGLVDGQAYYVRVQAVDAFGQVSAWSASEWTVQDDSGPGVPGLVTVPQFHPHTGIRLEWTGAEDDGVGVAYYEVNWSSDPGFQWGVLSKSSILGLACDLPVLEAGVTWYFRVRAYDRFDNPGPYEQASTYLDDTPPTVPVVDEEPAFTEGTSNTISWEGSTDEGSGVSRYEVRVHAHSGGTTPVFMDTTEGTTLEVGGLVDGMTYWYQVVAVDGAGNRRAAPVVSSTQDASPPLDPLIRPLSGLTPASTVVLEWYPSHDAGVGGVEYQVVWGIDSGPTSPPPDTSPWMTNTSYEVTGLFGSRYLFWVVARDGLGHVAYGEKVSTEVDTTPPTVPEVEELDEFTGSDSVTLTWNASQDAGGGPVEYQARVYDVPYVDDGPVTLSPWTTRTSWAFWGLRDRTEYYFEVVARDTHGWKVGTGIVTSTSIDTSPPYSSVWEGNVFSSSDYSISGHCIDYGSGVERVKALPRGSSDWIEANLFMMEWSIPMSELPEGTEEVLVYAVDAVGHVQLGPLRVYVDSSAPEVSIRSPVGGEVVPGVLQVVGTVSDRYLMSYSVEYLPPGSEEWVPIVPGRETDRANGTLATWVTGGLAAGDYVLRVSANDTTGHVSSKEVVVSVRGARLSIGPSDIVFSNPHPLPGETVTVFVTVHNGGAGMAEDVTVSVMDGGVELHREGGVSVPAGGIAVVSFELEARDAHWVTARATSDLYDTGEMAGGASLETIEEEGALEDVGGVLGLLGGILAVVAIVMVFLMSRRGAASEMRGADQLEAARMDEGEDA